VKVKNSRWKREWWNSGYLFLQFGGHVLEHGSGEWNEWDEMKWPSLLSHGISLPRILAIVLQRKVLHVCCVDICIYLSIYLFHSCHEFMSKIVSTLSCVVYPVIASSTNNPLQKTLLSSENLWLHYVLNV
jgi:hypothetical protein